MKFYQKNLLVSASVLFLSMYQITEASAQPYDYGIEHVSDTSGILYIVDQGWTGSFRYLCIANNCANGDLVNGRWQRTVSGLTLGSTYAVEFKIQDNNIGQILLQDNITFENTSNIDAGMADISTDSGTVDTGTNDIGPSDAGITDSATDVGIVDMGTSSDAGTDAGPMDANDAGSVDVSPDAGPQDASDFICVDAQREFNGQTLTTIPCSSYDNNFSEAQIELGRLLFFDKILSGNRNIACATCHHPDLALGDGLSLPIGEGGIGLGPNRTTGSGADAVVQRIPRNAPALFNLALDELNNSLFWDSRVNNVGNFIGPSGFDSPLRDRMPLGLDNTVAALTMLPVLDEFEMSGQPGENPIADAVASDNIELAWQLIADRLRDIPEYVSRFQDAFGVQATDIEFVHAANAISAFIMAGFRSDNSRYDQFVRGNDSALTELEQEGLQALSDVTCSQCHELPAFGRANFNAQTATPQIGPSIIDTRVMQAKVVSLRNVAITAPWNHAGPFTNLRDTVAHYRDPQTSLNNYDCQNTPILPSAPNLDSLDCVFMDDPVQVQNLVFRSFLGPAGLSMTDQQIDSIVAFLQALTDTSQMASAPQTVPSGLPVDTIE